MAADGVVAQAAQAALREMIEEIVATPGDQRGAWTLEIRTRTDALLGLATGETPGDRWLLTMASPRGSIHYHPRPFIPTIYMIFLGKKCWSWTFDKQTSDGNA